MLTLSCLPISLGPTGTEDRDQEIVRSAEGQNWNFGHETSALGSAIVKMRIVVSTVCSVFLACCGNKADPPRPSGSGKETDPQLIAESCAGPKPGEDDQHRIVDGWDALLRKCGRASREFYPDLHFVRGKPITLVFRAIFMSGAGQPITSSGSRTIDGLIRIRSKTPQTLLSPLV